MRYGIGPITDQDDISIVNSPETANESRVSYSYDDWKHLGDLDQPAPASGVITAQPGFVAPVDGLDLQVIATKAIRSDVAVVLTLAVVFADNTTGTAVGTFGPQAFNRDQTQNQGQFTAVDLVPNLAKKIKSITGVQTVLGGKAGNSFSIVSLPEKASFIQIKCKTQVDADIPFTKSKSIPCGLNPSAYTKPARGDEASLKLNARHYHAGDGLPRLGGHSVTTLVEIYKEDRILSERYVFSKWRPKTTTARGDGDDDVVDEAEGMFQDTAIFVS